MKKILVIRFSSFGDVAMTIPVIKELQEQNQELLFTVLSNKGFVTLFELSDIPFVGADLYGKHKGILGLYRLFKTLRKENFDAVVDLHGSLRSRIIRFFFGLSFTKTIVIDKGRKEKKDLIKLEDKTNLPTLTSTFQRYANSFISLGFSLKLSNRLTNFLDLDKSSENITIGFAPFARYKTKQLPLLKIVELVEKLNGLEKIDEVLLFGGKENKEHLEALSNHGLKLKSTIDWTLKEELSAISKLKVMISGDSANMHLASLTGTPVVSIWGATHPSAGFLGYGQKLENVVSKNLDCRPCSVFGNKPCWKKNNECVEDIEVEMILEKIKL